MEKGTTIGAYSIAGVAGEGATGVVYQARDTRLNRDVAIKALLAGTGSNPRRRERFEREARALGALNHPNIAAIHDILQQDDTTYLVLEFVDGPDLAELIQRGRVSSHEVIRIARAIAAALEAAHAKGVIHRDLKPANVKLTRDGEVKLVDFGIAALAQTVDNEGLPSAGVVDAARQTASHGTPAYMSPEQVSGREVDHRTDLWAFGCVLYELLTGARAFDGAPPTTSVPGALSAPDLTRLPTTTRRELVALLRQCLHVDPSARPASATEVGRVLDAIRTPSTSTALRRLRAVATNSPRAATAGLLVVIGLAGLGVWAPGWYASREVARTLTTLEGIWRGVVEAGPTKLRIAVHFERDERGLLTGTLDSRESTPLLLVRRSRSSVMPVWVSVPAVAQWFAEAN